MITLYQFELCPFSRQLRIMLTEKKLPYEMVSEKYWLRDTSFLKLNPAGETPVIKDGKLTIADIYSIIEYLEETHTEVPMLGESIKYKNEVRRLISWFNGKFYNEVSGKILSEKVISYYTKNSTPRSEMIRSAKANLYQHLDYISSLLEQRKWLAGEDFSLADIVAASHLSVLDFLNDMPWQHSQYVKDWYSVIKSRPSFRPLLSDYAQAFNPPAHYTDLDF